MKSQKGFLVELEVVVPRFIIVFHDETTRYALPEHEHEPLSVTMHAKMDIQRNRRLLDALPQIY